MLFAKRREQNRARTPNVERVKMPTASRLAARGNGKLTLRRAIRLQQLSDRRATAEGFTCELDACWLVAHRTLDPACRRLLRSNWLTVHGKDEPQTSTLGSLPGSLSDDGDPLALPPEADRFGGDISRE